VVLKEEKNAIKTLFCRPLGSFPRGSLATSLNVKILTKPDGLVLETSRGSKFSISKRSGVYTVTAIAGANIGGFKETCSSDFAEAVESLISPIVREEIISKCHLV
jgi:hypothetical protein